MITGRRTESKNNALWGSSKPGKRANALWGRSGRGGVIAIAAALTLALPLAAGARSTDKGTGGGGDQSFVSPGLLNSAKDHPNQKVHVIIQSALGTVDANAKMAGLGGKLRRQLTQIGAVAVDIPAGRLEALAKKPYLTITPDAPVQLSGEYSKQLWPYESGAARLWGTAQNPAPNAPTIAIVDSGIDPKRADFDYGSRVLPQVTMTSLKPNAPGDGRGHGTFVAGMAAGSAPGYAGAAPNARILPIDVMDDSGMALTSDVIAACDYILQNKTALNIRVANFSLHSAAMNHFYNDPLDRAVEKLWFNGIFVVAAAGNYGSASGPSGVLHAPGNDPFVMTVGALDIGQSALGSDDTNAPWSAYGRTEDGFWKPEVAAPGRYMVGPVPPTSTLVTERPDHVVAPGYMELSGTSFAAPVVAGGAAEILARHPDWTPDQVKGALMVTARPVSNAASGSMGVGAVNIGRAASLWRPPVANTGLKTFVKADGLGSLSFDAASWSEVVKSNASWAEASWSDVSWSEASWSEASWAELSFDQASWSDASWSDASWSDASWSDASWSDTSAEDAAEGDAAQPATLMDAAQSAALQADPDLALSAAQVAEDPVVDVPTP